MLLLTVIGRSDAKIRGCMRRRRSTLDGSARQAVIRRSREQYKIRLLVVVKVRSCWREPRGLGLGKPSLMMIRDERLEVVRGNGCCEARTWAAA